MGRLTQAHRLRWAVHSPSQPALTARPSPAPQPWSPRIAAVGGADVVFLLVAGVLAGVAGSVAGLASLVSYPALLAAGLPALTANVTNTVALVLYTVGAASFSAGAGRQGAAAPAGRDRGRRGQRGGVAVDPGRGLRAAGAGADRRGSLVLLLQPGITRLSGGLVDERSPALLAGVFGVGVYAGYFWAAAGVVLLALLTVSVAEPLARLVAARNVALGLANLVAAAGFALFGRSAGRRRPRWPPGSCSAVASGPGWSGGCPATACGSPSPCSAWASPSSSPSTPSGRAPAPGRLPAVTAERVLSTRELNRALLARQLLLERSGLPPEALEQVAGLQAQYAPSPYVGLWSRLRDFRRDDLTRALEDRRAVQATLLRVTIHIVSAADYPPLTEAVRAARREWWTRTVRRDLEGSTWRRPPPWSPSGWPRPGPPGRAAPAARRPRLPEGGLERGRALGGHGQGAAVGHLGAAPGRPVRPGRRLARPWKVDEDEALEHLVRRYLAGFGPASLADLGSWAGLP